MNYIQLLLAKLPKFDNLVLIKNLTKTDNDILVFAHIIDSCNYLCNYCCNLFPRSKTILNLNLLKLFLLDINKKTNKNILLIIVGGEPTLHPDLFDFCNSLKMYNYIDISIHTNFSKELSYYFKFFQFKNVRFIFSWHSLKNNLNDNFYKKAAKLKLLISNKKFKDLLFIVMYEHENTKFSIFLFLMLLSLNATVELSLIDVSVNLKRNNRYNYTNNEIEFAIKSNINNSVKQDMMLLFDNNEKYYISDFDYNCLIYYKYLTNFNNWKCTSGIDCIYVFSNNKVYPCVNTYIMDNDQLLKNNSCVYDIKLGYLLYKTPFVNCCEICGSTSFTKIRKINNEYL